MKSRVLPLGVLAALCWAGAAQAQFQNDLGSNKLNRGTLANTMNWGDCLKYNWTLANPIAVCAAGIPCQIGDETVACTYVAPQYNIDYWEPSEIIEVSCRKGYSLVAPNIATGGSKKDASAPMSCYGANGRGGGKWFFEARVWAVSGYFGGAREQSSSPQSVTLSRQCTKDKNDNSGGQYAGYGIKWGQFSLGSPSGPGGSFEAYISDNDQEWQKTSSSSGGGSTPGKCTGASVENCWGPMIHSGWVSHPNQAVAAATAAWRAHTIAVGKNMVSPPGSGGGYKLNMDYPFLYNTSPYAASMGISGGSASSGFLGSKCFQPGDPGPSWYTFQEKNLKPEDVPAFINSLKSGDISKAAEIHPGVYVFTVWVYTACSRYGSQAKYNYKTWCLEHESECPKYGLPKWKCQYEGKS